MTPFFSIGSLEATVPLKTSGPGRDPTVVDRWDSGLGWIAHPEERIQRASHAIESEDGAWLIDPVDAAGLDELLADVVHPSGGVAGLDDQQDLFAAGGHSAARQQVVDRR